MGYEVESMWMAMKGGHYKRTIEKLVKIVNGTTNLDEALSVGISVVVESVHAQIGTLWVYYEYEDGKIHQRVTYGGADLSDITLQYGEGIAGQVIKEGKPMMISDCQSDPRWAGRVDEKTGMRTESMLCVPLILEGKSFACLQLINRTDGLLFDEQDMNFAQNIANEVMLLLESHELLGRIHGPESSASFETFFCLGTESEMLELLRKTTVYAALPPRKQKAAEKYCIKLRDVFA